MRFSHRRSARDAVIQPAGPMRWPLRQAAPQSTVVRRGGVSGIEGLAALTGQPLIPLDPSCGQAGPIRRALIDEDRCIGCALCLKVCPTDAIIGAFRYLHTVVRDDCTGCELCLSPCPVDCIEMTSLPTDQWGAAEAARARQRFERREERLAPKTQGPQDHQHVLQAALLRAAQRRAP